jgi:hypothetical protein
LQTPRAALRFQRSGSSAQGGGSITLFLVVTT